LRHSVVLVAACALLASAPLRAQPAPADEGGAFICSFECTFCAECADALDETCPNCGGELLDRPARVGKALANSPASTVRRFKG